MYLNGIRELGIMLRCSEGVPILGHVDASFATHDNMRSHTGSFITLGGGPVNASSRKQSMVARSSTEAELIRASDALPQILWTREFLIEQGYSSCDCGLKIG
jgi:hypothetical protein